MGHSGMDEVNSGPFWTATVGPEGGPLHLRLAEMDDQRAQAPEHRGRLELTWTNKRFRLLADEDCRSDRASPSDYRVAEV